MIKKFQLILSTLIKNNFCWGVGQGWGSCTPIDSISWEKACSLEKEQEQRVESVVLQWPNKLHWMHNGHAIEKLCKYTIKIATE